MPPVMDDIESEKDYAVLYSKRLPNSTVVNVCTTKNLNENYLY